MDHDASRASPIIRVAIERQDLAAIATRGIDRALQLGEAALHELRAIGAGRHGNLDPGPCLIAVLPMRGEDDRIAQAVGLAEPQTVIETFHRRTLADIHVVILRRRDSGSIAVISGQRRDAQRLVAVLLKDAEKPDRRCREQPVDGHLNVRSHMTRELPRGRDQLVPRNAGEMPGQRVAGIIELLVADDFGQLARDLVPAVIADERLHAFQWKRALGGSAPQSLQRPFSPPSATASLVISNG